MKRWTRTASWLSWIGGWSLACAGCSCSADGAPGARDAGAMHDASDDDGGAVVDSGSGEADAAARDGGDGATDEGDATAPPDAELDGPDADAPDVPDADAPDADAPDADAPDAELPGACSNDSLAAIAGDYRDTAGREHWLRATETARLYAIVPPGLASPAAPPSLVEIIAVCADQRRLLAVDRQGRTQRIDWTADGAALWLCAGELGELSSEALLEQPAPSAADRASGCHGSAWLELEEAP